MGYANVSEELMLRLEGDENILFSNFALKNSILPTDEQITKAVTGVQFSYAYCGEQDGGIRPMLQAFGATDGGVITRTPDNFRLEESDSINVLKYGDTDIPARMFKLAKEVGMVGYWDEDNLIICASEKYNPFLKSIMELMQPEKKAHFAFRTILSKPNLMILI